MAENKRLFCMKVSHQMSTVYSVFLLLLLWKQPPLCSSMGDYRMPCDFNHLCTCGTWLDRENNIPGTISCEDAKLTALPEDLPGDNSEYTFDKNNFDFTDGNLFSSFRETFALNDSHSGPTKLSLNENPLKEFPSELGEFLSSLVVLFLNRCKLSEIRKDTFELFVNLNTITLNDNQLTTIHEETFTHQNLEVLELQRNRLPYLPRKIFRNLSTPGKKALKLEGNPLVCDCVLKEMRKMVYNLDCLSKNVINDLECTMSEKSNETFNICELVDEQMLICDEKKPEVVLAANEVNRSAEVTTTGIAASSVMAITGSVVGGMTVYTIAKLIMQTKSKSEISSIEDKMNINAVADMLTKFSDDLQKEKCRSKKAKSEEKDDNVMTITVRGAQDNDELN